MSVCPVFSAWLTPAHSLDFSLIVPVQGSGNLFLGPRRPGSILPCTSLHTLTWQITSVWSSWSAPPPPPPPPQAPQWSILWEAYLYGLCPWASVTSGFRLIAASVEHRQIKNSKEVKLRIFISLVSSLWVGCVSRQVSTPLKVAFSMWLSLPSSSSLCCPISFWIYRYYCC